MKRKTDSSRQEPSSRSISRREKWEQDCQEMQRRLREGQEVTHGEITVLLNRGKQLEEDMDPFVASLLGAARTWHRPALIQVLERWGKDVQTEEPPRGEQPRRPVGTYESNPETSVHSTQNKPPPPPSL